MGESVALKAPYRLTLVGAQVVFAPAGEVELDGWRHNQHKEHLPNWRLVPPGAQPLSRGLLVSLYYVEGQVQGVAFQNHLMAPFAGV